MIGTSMLYCALWALWLSAAAWMIERVMLNGRGPVRAVWISAIVLSIVGPVFGYGLSRRPAAPVVRAPVSVASSRSAVVRTSTMMTRPIPARPFAGRMAALRDIAARADRPLGIAWIALSLGLLVYIVGGLVHLRFVRRRWREQIVNGTRVMISEDSGPALVGVVRSTIVIPEWALSLEPDALALMLRHELEHQLAGDTRMLAAAELLLMLMPWNLMLWWQLSHLRLAIELDCDAPIRRHAYVVQFRACGRAPSLRSRRFRRRPDHRSDRQVDIDRRHERLGTDPGRPAAHAERKSAIRIHLECTVTPA